MLVRFETILFLLAVAFSTSRGGSIDEEFLKSFSHDEETKDAIVEFPEVIDKVLSDPDLNFLRGNERKSTIVKLLQKYTRSSQLPIINQIASLGLADKATPFWVANQISIKDVSLKSLKALAASSPEEFTIQKAETVNILPVDVGIPVEEHRVKRQAGEYQWGVQQIGAGIAIDNGITGAGVTIALIDTGASPTHEALIDNYKGGPYSWFDAVNGYNGGPYDDNGHGSHCTGIAVGKTNGIGVAPGAQWIACKCLNNQGSGSQAQVMTCMQWVACPNNSTGSCADFPNVLSCSLVGGMNQQNYNSAINSLVALDIVPVFAIGNTGVCRSAQSPGDLPNVISVGATGQDDILTYFSSKGPGGPVLTRPVGGPLNPIKPELVAPGLNIKSVDAQSDTGYIEYSGTSMATPHVAGAVALILQTDMSLGFVSVRDLLQTTAEKHDVNDQCSVLSSATSPNNFYGHGRISVSNALGLTK